MWDIKYRGCCGIRHPITFVLWITCPMRLNTLPLLVPLNKQAHRSISKTQQTKHNCLYMIDPMPTLLLTTWLTFFSQCTCLNSNFCLGSYLPLKLTNQKTLQAIMLDLALRGFLLHEMIVVTCEYKITQTLIKQHE